ncbi:MAG TPA: glutamine synthetase family protein [Streptosporangiaceae bacterium]|nr:glutamine synthetase family protein [Streptosporangiaceae bacterium]
MPDHLYPNDLFDGRGVAVHEASRTEVTAACERLRAQGVDVVRVSYPDLIGVDRGRDVLVDELPHAMEHGLAFCRAVYHTSPQGDVVPVQGGLDAGLPDILVQPDLGTLSPLPWEPNAAWCLGDAHTPDGEKAPESPREVTRRVAARLTELGCTLVTGPELEFFVCERQPDGSWQRYANEVGNVYVVGRKGDPRGLLLRMLRLLRDAGLGVTAANHEFSPGQFEINLTHSELVDAADRSFRLKSAVQEIARQQDLLATFMAKPFNDEGGSGFHVHASINDESGRNVFGDPDGQDGLSATGRHAIAGVIKHAPALSALLNPTINSFKRFGPDTLAPWLIDWGLDNRSAMVRIPPERGTAARMEVRLGDATANPYLAMAAVGAATYLGIKDQVEPPAKLEGYGYDPDKAGLLPQRLPDALDALAADHELASVLGEYFVESFLAYKRNEVERFERYVTDWEFREYSYHL